VFSGPFLTPFCGLTFFTNCASLLHLLVLVESALGSPKVEPHIQVALPLLHVGQLLGHGLERVERLPLHGVGFLAISRGRSHR
jgi:hypothetical protein